MQFDDLNNAKPLFSDWQHWVPFAALMVRASVGWRDAKHLWGAQEWVRGWLVGAMLIGVAG